MTENLYNIKKVGKQWLLRKPGKSFKRVSVLANVTKVELSDKFLIADEDIIYEIKEHRDDIVLVKIDDICVHEEQQKNEAEQFCKEKTDSFKLRNGAVEKPHEEDTLPMKSDNTRLKEKEPIKSISTFGDFHLREENDFLETPKKPFLDQTENSYNSLEVGQTEDSSLIETIDFITKSGNRTVEHADKLVGTVTSSGQKETETQTKGVSKETDTDDGASSEAVPVTLHDRTLEGLLTSSVPVVSSQPTPQPAQVPSSGPKPVAPVQTPSASASPPIIVSSPIKIQQDKDFMPPAMTKPSQEKFSEPSATFTIVASGEGVMLSSGSQQSSTLDQKKAEMAKAAAMTQKKPVTESKEKAMKQQEEYKRLQKEKEEKERIRQENERKREKEEEDALEMARSAQLQSEKEQQRDSERLKADREKERRREQERRRRQAIANQIDMNEQSALMAKYQDEL